MLCEEASVRCAIVERMRARDHRACCRTADGVLHRVVAEGLSAVGSDCLEPILYCVSATSICNGECSRYVLCARGPSSTPAKLRREQDKKRSSDQEKKIMTTSSAQLLVRQSHDYGEGRCILDLKT